MSFGDHAVLWLHVTAAIFTIGPGTAAIMSTPHYIRKQNPVVVGYLLRSTRIYSFASLLTLIFGLILTGMTHTFSPRRAPGTTRRPPPAICGSLPLSSAEESRRLAGWPRCSGW